MKKIIVSLLVFYSVFAAFGCVKQSPAVSMPTPDASQTIIALSFTITCTATITLTPTITPTRTKGVKTIVVIGADTPTVTPTL